MENPVPSACDRVLTGRRGVPGDCESGARYVFPQSAGAERDALRSPSSREGNPRQRQDNLGSAL